MYQLMDYFTQGITSKTLQTIGTEIETQFVDQTGKPISTQTSQRIFHQLVRLGWSVTSKKGTLITTLRDQDGNSLAYELGRHNLEVATKTSTADQILNVAKPCLSQLYQAAKIVRAEPYFAPILFGNDDVLVIPDERDAIWLELDGRQALAPLARISSVQFTVAVAVTDAITMLNRFGEQTDQFLATFPQDAIWKNYIKESSAGYLPTRYGGPLVFESLADYCHQLWHHAVVQGTHLVPASQVETLNIPLYLRSIWWHFRLKRFGTDLCIEVRPLARKTDDQLEDQLNQVLDIFSV